MLMMGYSTIYTSMPVFSLILDHDINEVACMKYPPLYKTLQKGRTLSTLTFLCWFWKSIYQGCAIMLGAILFFKESFANMVTITFSTLICIELLNVYSSVHHLKKGMILSQLFTFFIYVLSIALLRAYFDTTYITWEFCIRVLLLTAASWLPLHMVECIMNKLDPSEFQKVMKQEKS